MDTIDGSAKRPGSVCRAAITSQKRGRRSRVTTAATTSSSGTGLYIKYNTIGVHYLVGTGAFSSVHPASSHDKNIIDTDPLLLTAVNGSTIPTQVTRDIELPYKRPEIHMDLPVGGGHTTSSGFRFPGSPQPISIHRTLPASA